MGQVTYLLPESYAALGTSAWLSDPSKRANGKTKSMPLQFGCLFGDEEIITKFLMNVRYGAHSHSLASLITAIL